MTKKEQEILTRSRDSWQKEAELNGQNAADWQAKAVALQKRLDIKEKK